MFPSTQQGKKKKKETDFHGKRFSIYHLPSDMKRRGKRDIKDFRLGKP